MMYRVYGDIYSGNCYKIKLLLNMLGLAHRWIPVDIAAGETHTAEFIAMNPNTRVPVLVIEGDDGTEEVLCESNAILNYLADGTPLLPDERLARARVLQWQCFEQYSHEPFIAVARYINKYLGLPKEREAEYRGKQEGGHKALSIMEQQLQRAPFLVGDSLSIADISLYAYTHVAPEGGFELGGYPGIRRWLDAVAAAEGYISMDAAAAD